MRVRRNLVAPKRNLTEIGLVSVEIPHCGRGRPKMTEIERTWISACFACARRGCCPGFVFAACVFKGRRPIEPERPSTVGAFQRLLCLAPQHAEKRSFLGDHGTNCRLALALRAFFPQDTTNRPTQNLGARIVTLLAQLCFPSQVSVQLFQGDPQSSCGTPRCLPAPRSRLASPRPAMTNTSMKSGTTMSKIVTSCALPRLHILCALVRRCACQQADKSGPGGIAKARTCFAAWPSAAIAAPSFSQHSNPESAISCIICPANVSKGGCSEIHRRMGRYPPCRGRGA